MNLISNPDIIINLQKAIQTAAARFMSDVLDRKPDALNIHLSLPYHDPKNDSIVTNIINLDSREGIRMYLRVFNDPFMDPRNPIINETIGLRSEFLNTNTNEESNICLMIGRITYEDSSYLAEIVRRLISEYFHKHYTGDCYLE